MRNMTPIEWILSLLTFAVIGLGVENYRLIVQSREMQERVNGLEQGYGSRLTLLERGVPVFHQSGERNPAAMFTWAVSNAYTGFITNTHPDVYRVSWHFDVPAITTNYTVEESEPR